MPAVFQPMRMKTNVPEWRTTFKRWMVASGLSLQEAVRVQGRLLFDRLINWRGGAIATPPKSQSQGKRAVARDIYRAVFPLRAEGFNNVRVRNKVRAAIEAGDHVSLQAMAKAGVFGKNLMRAFVAKFDPIMHTSQRKSRGRVPRTSAKSYRYATDDVAELKAYIEEKQKNVGQAKGGWAAALQRLGGKPAAWVARHSQWGTFEDDTKNPKHPSFVGINNSQWAKGGDEDRIVEMALVGREMAMKKDMERRMEDLWVKF